VIVAFDRFSLRIADILAVAHTDVRTSVSGLGV
jgi:hypothetical protein